jgi:methionine-gamma-lyase
MKRQTKLIHSQKFDPMDSRPVNTPIFQTSTFYFDNFDQVERVFSLKERNFVYTRGGNPTVNLLESRLAELEKGIDAVCFSSGMGAISTTLISLLQSGDSIIVSDVIYGSSYVFIKNILSKFGIRVYIEDFDDLENIQNILTKDKHVKVIYFETPCNPTLKLIDIQAIVKLAKITNAKVVVDNTFATPIFQNPLDLGADIVVHSLTKYLNGHGDALGGVAISRDQKYIDSLKFGYMCEIGASMDPNSASLILRGLKTLYIRMKLHESNATKVAEFLTTHPKISKVIYPALDNYQYKDIAINQMSGHGGIVSIYMKENNPEKIKSFIESLSLFKIAASLGDADSLVAYPLFMTHRSYLSDEKSIVYNGMLSLIRLSIGLEHDEDLVNDLKHALDHVI